MYSGRLNPSENESVICFPLSGLTCEISGNYQTSVFPPSDRPGYIYLKIESNDIKIYKNETF